ncbi:MAG: MFS transporter [Candidatus Helarchaeota archaeon]
MDFSSKSWYKWFILSIFWINFFVSAGSWLFTLSIKYDIAFLGVYLTDIERSLLITLPMVGLVAMAFFSGMIIDKIGVKKSSILSFSIITIFGFLRGLCPDFISFSIVLILFGMGKGLIFAIPSKLIAEWFPQKEYGTSHGILIMGSGFGIFFFEFINRPLIYESLFAIFGGEAWRFNFFIFAGMSLSGLVLWIIFSRDRSHQQERAKKSNISLARTLKVVAKEKQVWLICLAHTAIVVGYFAAKHFISEIYGMRSVSSNVIFGIVSMISLGAMISNVSMAMLSDRLGKRRIFIMSGLVGTGIFLVVSSLTISITIANIIFLFITGFCVGTVVPITSSMLIEHLEHEYVATAISFLVFFSNLGALIAPNVLELLAVTELDYILVLLIPMIFCFIGAGFMLLTRDSKSLRELRKQD